MPANYSTLSVGQVMRALTKRLPGSLLPNSVTPRNLFPISTRRTRPNLALCQVFLKTSNFWCFPFFLRISLIIFMFKLNLELYLLQGHFYILPFRFRNIFRPFSWIPLFSLPLTLKNHSPSTGPQLCLYFRPFRFPHFPHTQE